MIIIHMKKGVIQRIDFPQGPKEVTKWKVEFIYPIPMVTKEIIPRIMIDTDKIEIQAVTEGEENMTVYPMKVAKSSVHATIPTRAHPNDAGLDLYAAENVSIAPHGRMVVKTDIRMAIPECYVGIIKDRSGVASKMGLETLAGVVDSNYRGDIGIVLHNTNPDEWKQVKQGDKIAQIIIVPYLAPLINEVTVEMLDETERGSKGFGSTGLNKGQ